MNKKTMYYLFLASCLFAGGQPAFANELAGDAQPVLEKTPLYFKDGEFWYDQEGNKIIEPSVSQSSSNETQTASTLTEGSKEGTPTSIGSSSSENPEKVNSSSESKDPNKELPTTQIEANMEYTNDYERKKERIPEKQQIEGAVVAVEVGSSASTPTAVSASAEDTVESYSSKEIPPKVAPAAEKSLVAIQSNTQERLPETGSKKNNLLVLIGGMFLASALVLIQGAKKKRFQ